MALNTNQGIELLVQSTLVGRIPKGIRVAARLSLAGGFMHILIFDGEAKAVTQPDKLVTKK